MTAHPYARSIVWHEHTSDLYSLGLVCLSLLTGASPFAWIEPSNPSSFCFTDLRETPSYALQKLLAKLTSHSICNRYHSVDEVIRDMQSAGAKVSLSSSKSLTDPTRRIARESWVCTSILKGATTALHSVAIHPKGQWVFSGSEIGQILAWDLPSGSLKQMISAHRNCLTAISISPDGQYLATASDDQTIALWQIVPDLPDTLLQPLGTLFGHTHCIKALAFSPDGQTIASGSWDKTIRLWDFKSQKPLRAYSGHRLGISALAFCPQGRWIASGGLNSEVLLWSLELSDVKPFTSLTGHARKIASLAYSFDGLSIASGSSDGSICLWSLSSDFYPKLNTVQTLSAPGSFHSKKHFEEVETEA